MGYRSEIVVRITHVEPTKMQQIYIDCMLQQLPWYRYTKAHLNEWNESYWNPENGILLYVDQWKWYESFAIVRHTENMWDYFEALGTEDPGLSGAFLRIGDDTTDIEERHFNEGWELANINRNLEYK